MKTRINQQYKKQRKQIYSVTLDPNVVAESVSISEDGNFSKHTEKALKFYNSYINADIKIESLCKS